LERLLSVGLLLKGAWQNIVWATLTAEFPGTTAPAQYLWVVFRNDRSQSPA
jgi:hypothetical protein